MTHTTEQRIRMKAYEIWLREGCPEGSDQRHWEMAKKFIAGEEAKSTLTSRFFEVPETDEAASPPAAIAPVKRKAARVSKAKPH
ncbi:DUF2934 domain-containing protein [Labrys okinawensis]|uniref:DUF2934 domain-containing protein n=1 Tax=Labrys okinawensis TaxID=346911 RepID=UPI0039BD9130